MRRLMRFVLSGITVGLMAGTASANDDGKVPFSEFTVFQFNASAGLPDSLRSMGESLDQHVVSTCSPGGSTPTPAAAPLAAAFGGIVLDWLFSRAATGINKRLQKRIKAHSAAYESPAYFDDLFRPDKWNGTMSCVVAQRIDCRIAPGALAEPRTARCGSDGEAGLSLAFRLEDGGGFLRAMPVAYRWDRLNARHAQGDAALAAAVRLDAVGKTRRAGYVWSSGSVALLARSCAADPSPKGQAWARIDAACQEKWVIDDDTRARARPIPMPPRLTQAVVVEVGEVGEPSSRLKGFAAFLEANGEAMSAALSTAFKKKLELAE